MVEYLMNFGKTIYMILLFNLILSNNVTDYFVEFNIFT